MNEVRLNSLFDKYRNGTLTERERSELERELLSSAPARDLFWKQARFHALLARWGQESWGRRMVDVPVEEEPITKPTTWRWWWSGLAAAAAAAAIVVVAVIFHGRRTEPVPPGVAVLALASGVEWTDAGHVPGALLSPGWLRLKTGAAQVEFYSGARVIIEGPAEVQLISTTEAFCRVGRLSARVPVAARGFKVGAPGMLVTDLGTEFGVNVAPAGASEVHVFTGKVELRRLNAAPAPVELAAGKAVRVEAAALVDIPVNRSAFLSEFELASRASADAHDRQTMWNRSSRVLSSDPAALVHFTFVDQQPWSRTLVNQATGMNAGTAGAIVGCQWTEGRWPGKAALQFKSSADRVRFDVPGQFHAVTLLAWVRVESLLNVYHTLLSPDSTAPGSLRWGLTKSGRLRLGIAKDFGRPNPEWEVVMSEPVVTPEQFGQWLMLTTVFDGKKVRHYLNGQPVGELAAYSPVPLRIGAAELGNWRSDTSRNIAAGMDEYAILARAMTDAEVQSVYELSRPGMPVNIDTRNMNNLIW